MRVTKQQYLKVLAAITQPALDALKQANSAYLEQTRDRARQLLIEEHQVTCFEYIPAKEQAAAAAKYRKALKLVLVLCNSTLEARAEQARLAEERYSYDEECYSYDDLVNRDVEAALAAESVR